MELFFILFIFGIMLGFIAHFIKFLFSSNDEKEVDTTNPFL